MADRAHWKQSIIDEDGNAILTGVLVEVRYPDGGGLVPLFVAKTAGAGKANPFAGDSEGIAEFYAAAAKVDITVSHASFGTRTYEDWVLLADVPVLVSYGYVAANVTSGNVDDLSVPGLTNTSATLDLNPNSGDAVIRSLEWDGLDDGQEITVTNVHASNLLTFKANDTNNTTGLPFRGSYDLAVPYLSTVTIKKSIGANAWILKP
jgi:hypothetical protein